MMKLLMRAVAVATVFAWPVMSFAESNTAVTHAQLLAELAALEDVGYNPAGEHLYYPIDLKAAEDRVAAKNRRDEGDNAQ